MLNSNQNLFGLSSKPTGACSLKLFPSCNCNIVCLPLLNISTVIEILQTGQGAQLWLHLLAHIRLLQKRFDCKYPSFHPSSKMLD